jgi:Na+/melibiose symporter-like transporter
MPRGIKIVLFINTLLLALFAGNLMVFYAEGVTKTVTFIVSWSALACLLALMFGIVLRGRLWHRISRIAIYTLAMVFGLQIMSTVSSILSWNTLVNGAGLAIAIVYLIGARGYLNSEPALRWFVVDADETPDNAA